MRLRIDTTGVRFQVAALAEPRTTSRRDKTQKTTWDKRPIWVVKLNAIDAGAGKNGSMEPIWVEVPGAQPVLEFAADVTVEGLTYDPYIGGKGTPDPKIVRWFRAESISMTAGARRS
jgi:hypothetical protein